MRARILFACLLLLVVYDAHRTAESLPLPQPIASTYQVLPPVPGYVPVYIRKGDTPLEEINPDLAEAFRSRSRASHEKSPESVGIGTADVGIKSVHVPYVPIAEQVDYATHENNDQNLIISRDSKFDAHANIVNIPSY